MVISWRGGRTVVNEGLETMTNTRFPGRPGWRAGRGNGTHRTKVRHVDVIAPAFPSASAASEGILGTARARERLEHFRNTFGCSSDEEDFAGYTDSAIEDVAKRYRALIKASEVVNIGQEHRSASTDHRITKPSSSVLPTGFSLSSPVIPRLCGSVTRFPGSFPRPSGSILSVQAGTVPVPRGSCAPKSRTFSELSQSIPRLSGTDHECPTRAALESKDTCKVSRSLYLEQTEVSRHDPEQYSNTDWNHNQVAPSRPPKVKSGKAGSLWQCRRKGFERRWIRKRDAAIYGRSPASRHREEERYLAEEEILSGTISPDSGNDSAQSNSSSPTEFVDLMTRKSSSSSSSSSTSTSTSVLTFDLPIPSSPALLDRQRPPAGQTPSPLPAAAAAQWRKRRCRRCSGCLSNDCGVCYSCRDMVKYGGRGISKQACCHRRCRQPIHPSPNHHHHQSPSPRRMPSTMRTGSSSNSSTSSLHPVGTSSPSTGWQIFHSELPTACSAQDVTDFANSSFNTPDRVTIGSEVIRSPAALPPHKLGRPLLRPPLLSSPSSLLTVNHLQGNGRVLPQGEAVEKNAIWASIVKLVDGYLLEQLRQKRDIDKSLEDSLYSSIRDLVKTILPTRGIDPKALGLEEDTVEVNTTGCARALPFTTRKPRDMFSFLLSEHRRLVSASQTNRSSDEMNFDQTQRRFGGDMSAMGRFRQMNRRPLSNTVYVSRSDIHSRGLFGARDIEAGEALVEYTGQVIRAALTDKRERHYEGLGVGCYMFRLDKTRVVDATLMGSAARFINHSCEPNCYSRVVQSSTGVKHIVIFSLRDIKRGEELTYDYKFPIENVKIPCSCGSKKCRKYLN